MKKMNYPIGHILKMMDITEGTIRNYEKKGLIKRKSDEDHFFRHYDCRDLSRVESIRQYRSMNFSIHEIKDLLDCDNTETVLALFDKQKQQISDMILKLQDCQKNLDRESDKIRRAEIYLGKYDLIDDPGFLFNSYMGSENKENQSGIHDFKDYATILKKEQVGGTIYPIKGYITENKDKRQGLCLYTVIEISPYHDGVQSFSQVIEEPLKFMSSRGYRLCGDILGIKLLTLTKNGLQYDYYELYLPVEPE